MLLNLAIIIRYLPLKLEFANIVPVLYCNYYVSYCCTVQTARFTLAKKMDKFLKCVADPVKELKLPQDAAFKEANIAVSEELKKWSVKCKRGEESNHVYTNKMKTKIALYSH